MRPESEHDARIWVQYDECLARGRAAIAANDQQAFNIAHAEAKVLYDQLQSPDTQYEGKTPEKVAFNLETLEMARRGEDISYRG